MMQRRERGFGLVEVVVGLSILGVAFFSLIVVGRNIARLSTDVTYSLQADFLLEEGIEAMRSIRDRSWNTYFAPLSGTTSLSFSTSTSRWSTTATQEIVSGTFWRNVTVSSVSRDGNDDIVTSGGTPDANTKKVTVSVSWHNSAGTTSRSFATYFTNYFND